MLLRLLAPKADGSPPDEHRQAALWAELSKWLQPGYSTVFPWLAGNSHVCVEPKDVAAPPAAPSQGFG